MEGSTGDILYWVHSGDNQLHTNSINFLFSISAPAENLQLEKRYVVLDILVSNSIRGWARPFLAFQCAQCCCFPKTKFSLEEHCFVYQEWVVTHCESANKRRLLDFHRHPYTFQLGRRRSVPSIPAGSIAGQSCRVLLLRYSVYYLRK